jgi:glycogen debranching enzyme
MQAGPHHILAISSRADNRTRVLKHADTFAVFDYRGEIESEGSSEQGLYHDGTRFLSCLLLDLDGASPFVLSSTVRHENDQLVVVMSNPDMVTGGRVVPMGALCLSVRKFLWNRACYQQIQVTSYALQHVEMALSIRFHSDFADIFEVRGMKRKVRGRELDPELTMDSVVLSYEGLDGVVRRTRLRFSPQPVLMSASMARFHVSLAPKEEVTLFATAACEPRGSESAVVYSFDRARSASQVHLDRVGASTCHVQTSNSHFNAWFDRAVSDLQMLTTELPTGPYPYAGVPWFNTPFGRDGIITALECLYFQPDLARGVLGYLASTQSASHIPEQDAEPGKILHETRSGEMAVLKEMPFGRYYGSVDATPLFVVLAGAWYRRTGDRAFIASIWPNIDRALEWIDRYGDPDGDGFVEYQRKSRDGLIHQGWKDSDDAVFHNDGTLAEGSIALCEVQGYVYAARKAGAAIADALGMEARARQLEADADALRERFERIFWCDEMSTYALALDGDKRPCRVRSSNAGQCLFTGIVRHDRAARLVRTLFSPESFAGWGIRTTPSSEPRYNPMGYHTGAIWPHDNALIAFGLAQYGFKRKAAKLLTGLFEASIHFDLHRMPELFCGFQQVAGEGPILYPLACSPQAWSSASVFLLLQACIGLDIDAAENRVLLVRPHLPVPIERLCISNLEVAEGTVDLLLNHHGDDVSVQVLRRENDVQVIVTK